MEIGKRRWISLFACMVSALFGGVIYSWSVYVNPLHTKFEAAGWTVGAISLAYTINIVVSSLSPLCLGGLKKAVKTKTYTFIGGIVYSAGMILCSFIQKSIFELYLYFGVLTAIGIGMIYLNLATYVVQLFPDKKGMAAGLFTASYACGALCWAPSAGKMIASAGGDPSHAFRMLGILFLIVICIASQFIMEIPAGYTGEGAKDGAKAAAKPALPPIYEKAPGQLLSTPLYYVVVALYVCGLISGMMVLSLGSPIVQGSLGYSPQEAAAVVGLFSLTSMLGRLFWGWMSDRIGRMNVIHTLGVITLVSMLILAFVKVPSVFFVALLAVPMCYGSYAATLSPVVLETFGAKHFAMNYNVVFVAFAVASLIGPQVVTHVKESSGGYTGAFVFGIGFAVSAIALSIIFRAMGAKIRAAKSAA